MNIKPLKIGELIARLPIIQGGMGVGVSRSKLATAVTNAGGIGVISSAQIGYDEEGFKQNPINANLIALRKHIKKAKKDVKDGIIGLNIMVALTNYEKYVETAIQSGIDLIISGAGLPTKLPELVKNSKVKIAPIVSSLRSAKTILKVWDRKSKTTADMVVIEGPKAGGHLGFSLDQLQNNSVDLDQVLLEVLNEVKFYEEKYDKQIPVVVAGGIYTGADIAHFLKLGASGVQMATRFIATEECDAHENFKKMYVNCSKNQIELVKSPVGLPGRAISNQLVEKIKHENVLSEQCYGCLSLDHCDRVNIPYCISQKLIEAVKGDVDNGLFFCGDTAHRINKIVKVQDLMNELETDILAVE
ncbi:nitronate monooxygenase [Mycoplasmatota bacterium]|nr:nitronate monooxygenase [Mycoplasmatota bacterium]